MRFYLYYVLVFYWKFIPPKSLLRIRFDSWSASSIAFLTGKTVKDLILNQVLLKMPAFEQAVK